LVDRLELLRREPDDNRFDFFAVRHALAPSEDADTIANSS
jgi:hypothetical protein